MTDLQERIFFAVLHEEKLPIPTKEYKFSPGRRFRFDYAWLEEKVALEVEGGVWTRGRHTRGKGFLGDMEKYNLAVCEGWKVLRTVPEDVSKIETINYLKILL